MKTLAILVLGVLLGAVGLGAAVKYSPEVQKVLVVPAACSHTKAACSCTDCHCDPCVCENCTCEKCAGKAKAAKKAAAPCCPGQNLDPAKECATPNTPKK